MNFASLLLGLAGPLAQRVFAALGLAFVVYQGASAALDYIIDQSISYFLGGLPPEVLTLLRLSGVFEAFGILSGGVTAKFSMKPLARIIPDPDSA